MRSTRNGQGWVLGWPHPFAHRIRPREEELTAQGLKGHSPPISGEKESTFHPALLPALSTHMCTCVHTRKHTRTHISTHVHTHANDRCCLAFTWTVGRSHGQPHGARGRRPSSEQEHHLAESGEQPPPHPTSQHRPASRPPRWLQRSGSS